MNACKCGSSSEKPSYAQLVTGEIASIGGWEFDLNTMVNTMEGRWTEEVARIHEVDPDLKPDVAWALSFYTDDSRPKIERAVNDAITRVLPFDLELEIVGAKGTRKWVRTKGVPVVTDGKVVQVQAFSRTSRSRSRPNDRSKKARRGWR